MLMGYRTAAREREKFNSRMLGVKPGRNDSCSCGSGKKFKHCCEGKDSSRTTTPPSAEINPLIALHNAGRYAELESRVRSLLGQYPGPGFGWRLLGGALQMQGRNALLAFQKAAELMPGEAEAHSNLGAALYCFGQHNGAGILPSCDGA
jgi:hypothetical protein